MKKLLAFVMLVMFASVVGAFDISPTLSLTSDVTSTTSTAMITAVAIDPDTDPDVQDIFSLKIFQDGTEVASSTCDGVVGTCVLVHIAYIPLAGTHSYTATTIDNEGHSVSTSTPIVITFTGTNVPPTLSTLPNVTINEDSGANIGLIDLWAFASDFETADANLIYTITVESNLSMADCGVANNRFINCSTVTQDAFGASSVNVTVSDGEHTANSSFTVFVRAVNDAVFVNNATVVANITILEEGNATINFFNAFMDVDNATFNYVAIDAPDSLNLTFNGTNLTIIGKLNETRDSLVTITASDGQFTAQRTINVTIIPVNDAPIALTIVNQTWPEDTNHSFSIFSRFTDIDSPDLNWTVSGNMFIAVLIDNLTGLVTAIPAADFFGNETVTFTATDGNLTASAPITFLIVSPVNDAPVYNSTVTLANVTTLEDINATFNIALAFFDIDSVDLNWTATKTGPFNVFINQLTGDVLISPLANQSGNGTITFTAFDGFLTSGASNTVFVTITPVNDVPAQISNVPNVTFAEDSTTSISLVPFFTDVDNTTLLYSAVSSNVNITAFVNGSVLQFSAILDYFGNGTVTVTASDGALSVDSNVFTIVVSPVNDVPVLVAPITNITTTEESSSFLDLTPFFTDVDNTSLLFTPIFNSAQVSVIMNGAIANITGNLNFVGNSSITFTASDGSLNVSGDMLATFTNVNDAPILAIPINNLTWAEDTVQTFNITSFFTDVDGDVLTWTASVVPNIAVSINNSNGIVTLTPALDFFGAQTVVFTADDGALTANSNTVFLTVNEMTDPPVLVSTIANITLNEEANDTFNILGAFTDVDSPDLNWTVTGNTNVLVYINNETGDVNISLVPNFFGNETLTFIASDGAATAFSNNVTILVLPLPDAPVFNPALVNQNGNANATFTYDINAADVDGDVVTFNNDNTTLFTINNVTGVISFTPIQQETIAVTVNVCDLLICVPSSFNITVGPELPPAPVPAPSGGGGGGGGGSSRSRGSSSSSYNITQPTLTLPIIDLFPLEEFEEDTTAGNDTIVIVQPTTETVPIEPVLPTGAVIVKAPFPEFNPGMLIVAGILIFGLLGYFIVRKLI